MNRSCLIANRGEIAVRIINACRELGIRACAVYSPADARALHVQLADAAFPLEGEQLVDTYLNIPQLLAAAAAMQCESVHPGYGFLSENAEFAQAAIDAGLIWIGPPPYAIRAMGVKTEARAIMQAAGVPVVPGFQSTDAPLEAYHAAAVSIGYPVLVKAAGGGGGKGIRAVRNADQLEEALASARNEARHAFASAEVYLEKYISPARHIEIQVLADSFGGAVHLFERDCSAQRRHQKVIEESPAPRLSAEIRERMGAAAVAAARAVGYVNAGTVEFIVDMRDETAFYFLEMNTRLQVEHPVTECVTGQDLVKLQFAIANGERLPFTQDQLRQFGHAIECRIYAEAPESGFLPSTGKLHRLRFPHLPGIRIETGVMEGDSITHLYDPLVAKMIAYADTREAAIRRLSAALDRTAVLGIDTNISFLKWLISQPEFEQGEMDTGFIERSLDRMRGSHQTVASGERLDAALIAAAFAEMLNEMNPMDSFRVSAADSWDNQDRFRLGE